MTLGDLLFIGAFIVLPLAIILWSLTTLRALRRRSSGRASPLTTQELPAVLPRRHRSIPPELVGGPERVVDSTPSDVPRRVRQPVYRGRSGGVVRRLSGPIARWDVRHGRSSRRTTAGRRR